MDRLIGTTAHPPSLRRLGRWLATALRPTSGIRSARAVRDDRSRAPAEGPAMTNEFSVIGHRSDDAEDLLLLGGDGRRYHYHLSDNRIETVNSPEGWVLNADPASSAPSDEHDPPAQPGR